MQRLHFNRVFVNAPTEYVDADVVGNVEISNPDRANSSPAGELCRARHGVGFRYLPEPDDAPMIRVEQSVFVVEVNR